MFTLNNFKMSILSIFIFSTIIISQTNHNELFEKAKYTMETKGDLQSAINLFEEIIQQYPTEKEYGAKSQFYIGICYQKLGLNKAKKAFEKVINNYPTETEIVSLAKEKLSFLFGAKTIIREEDKEFSIRQVWAGPKMDDTGEISPDNRYLSFVDWETGDLAIREMTTGKRRRLTHKKGSWLESNEFAYASRWSHDSKQIAYTWCNDNPPICDLRIVEIDGKKPRILYHGDYFKDWVVPHDWSPDGKYILTSFFREIGSPELGLVSVEDGSVHPLKTIHGIDPYPIEAQFSPDGRYIVYDFPQEQNSRKTDISLISSDGEHEIALIEHPADDRLLGWSPDGKSILFVSDRTGTWDAWIIQVSEGRPIGNPHLIRREIGLIGSLGFTQDGSFYYSTPGLFSDIYSASIDPETGKIVNPPKKNPLPYEGQNIRPDLSPDGKHLVYISLRGPAGRKSVLCIYSLESGEVRELSPKAEFRYFSYPRWTPDGCSILLRADHLKEGKGIYKVNSQTGETTLLIQKKDEAPAWSPVVSLDGRSVFYIRETSKEFYQIMKRNLETGKEKEFYRTPPHDNNIIALSPDGQRLALMMREEEDMRVLKVFQITGGEPIELHRFWQGGRHIIDIDWSPDGRYIYFEKRRHDPESENWMLWRISSEGGEAQNLGLAMHSFTQISIHPDGKRITFASSSMHEKVGAAVWLMENFLNTVLDKQ